MPLYHQSQEDIQLMWHLDALFPTHNQKISVLPNSFKIDISGKRSLEKKEKKSKDKVSRLAIQVMKPPACKITYKLSVSLHVTNQKHGAPSIQQPRRHYRPGQVLGNPTLTKYTQKKYTQSVMVVTLCAI